MSERATGGKPVVFQFVEDFDRIFGKDPNVEPVAICESTDEKQQGLVGRGKITRVYPLGDMAFGY